MFINTNRTLRHTRFVYIFYYFLFCLYFTDHEEAVRIQHNHDKTQVQTHDQTHFGIAVRFAAVQTSCRQTARRRAMGEAQKTNTTAGQQTGG